MVSFPLTDHADRLEYDGLMEQAEVREMDIALHGRNDSVHTSGEIYGFFDQLKYLYVKNSEIS